MRFQLCNLSAAPVFIQQVNTCFVQLFDRLFCVCIFACRKENVFSRFRKCPSADEAVADLTDIDRALKNVRRNTEKYFACVLTAENGLRKLNIYNGCALADGGFSFAVAGADRFTLDAIAFAALADDSIAADG